MLEDGRQLKSRQRDGLAASGEILHVICGHSRCRPFSSGWAGTALADTNFEKCNNWQSRALRCDLTSSDQDNDTEAAHHVSAGPQQDRPQLPLEG